MEYKVENPTILLAFLQSKFSKKEAKQYLSHEAVFVNNHLITKYNFLLRTNDIIKIKKEHTHLDVLYEDNDIIVINKEAGLLTVATEKSNNSLYYSVSDYVKQKDKRNKIFVIHRLDRDTSGIVMFAKNERVKNYYQDTWNELVVKRGYVALVDGLTELQGTIQSYLKETEYYVYSTKDKNNKLAITHYERIKKYEKQSLLAITIDSGRKNQIRVHMKDIGHVIIGDTKYGNINAKRLYLHANILIITNPITQKIMTFHSDIPWKI